MELIVVAFLIANLLTSLMVVREIKSFSYFYEPVTLESFIEELREEEVLPLAPVSTVKTESSVPVSSNESHQAWRNTYGETISAPTVSPQAPIVQLKVEPLARPGGFV